MRAESVDDSLTAATGEIDLDLDGETFTRNKNSGKMWIFFQNAESTKIFVFVEMIAFYEAVFVEGVMDFAGGDGRRWREWRWRRRLSKR